MNMTTTVSFPGIGILPFNLNRLAFEMGSIKVYWYGIIICLGILLGFLTAYIRMKKIGVTSDDLSDIALICVPSAIVGARLYYVLAEIESYKTLYDVIAVWNGGLAIYGGVIAGVISFTVVCKYKKKPLFKMYDCAAPGLILGQIIGRWGNFFNAEAYGISESYDFLGAKFDISHFSSVNPLRMTIDGMTVHPTFLYESLWNFIGFVLMNIFFKKKAFDGEVLLWYLTWYGLGRCLIEGLRGDSLYLGSIRVSQLIAFLCFVLGLFAITVLRIKTYKERKIENGNNN
ncbi:MAG: prolipoprotein diacylglyceryl transferase [Oscillospiraceae bacterium]|nr:prolipoprotein diacylglyceryl transferase [Oscillospiraceae bacterium]